MKKLLLISAVALFTAGTLLTVTSCSDDNPISCTQKLVDVTSAAQDYALDDSDANCLAYKDALEDYIDCDGIADKVYYENILENLPCY